MSSAKPATCFTISSIRGSVDEPVAPGAASVRRPVQTTSTPATPARGRELRVAGTPTGPPVCRGRRHPSRVPARVRAPWKNRLNSHGLQLMCYGSCNGKHVQWEACAMPNFEEPSSRASNAPRAACLRRRVLGSDLSVMRPCGDGQVVTEAQAATRATHLRFVAAMVGEPNDGAVRAGADGDLRLRFLARRAGVHVTDEAVCEPPGVHLWPATMGEVGQVGGVRRRPGLSPAAGGLTITGDPAPDCEQGREDEH